MLGQNLEPGPQDRYERKTHRNRSARRIGLEPAARGDVDDSPVKGDIGDLKRQGFRCPETSKGHNIRDCP